ncbi:MAG: hypothetical protein Q8R83_02675 [Legionellaceae bacterium]|nr:hypothetical protein [Legionellaceae bacterium]
MCTTLLLSFFWFLIFIITHNVAFFVLDNQSRAKIIINTFKLSICALFISIWLYSKYSHFFNNHEFYPVFWNYLYGLVISVSFFILYMPFYYTVASSLSIQSMIKIFDNSLAGKNTELDCLREQFTSKELMQDRMSLMIDNGYIYEFENKYYLTTKGKRTAKIFSQIKNIWKLGAGG